jgi:aldehyde dehydrogenase (NAD+)
MSTLSGEDRMLIDGNLVQAASGKTFDNINPATEEVLGSVADAGAEDMRRAIEAARRAFDRSDWSTNRALRRRCLEQLQHALENERELFREEIIAEAGAPRMITHGPQVDTPIDEVLRYPLGLIDDYPWVQDLPDLVVHGSDVRGSRSRRQIWKEPIGVVGAIAPWNFPLDVTLVKVGQILATGNTAVLKPAPDTPWNATHLGRIIAEQTDIPPGVFNVVTSSDHLVGEELSRSPLVDMISFTGSTATGQRIMKVASQTLKRLVLELGGKSAMVVLGDADLEGILPAATSVCYHAGQGCALQTRILLPRGRYREGVDLIAAAMERVPYGDPNDSKVIMGPLVSATQKERVLSHIESGQRDGAKLILGGGTPAHLQRGFYVEPTLFADVDNSMSIAQKEIFGPVLCVIPYDDEGDAIRIANDTIYGLSGSVFSGSLERAASVASRLRAGTVSVNGGNWGGVDAPYGGYKQSGIGRQNGIEGFEQHLDTKVVGLPIMN